MAAETPAIDYDAIVREQMLGVPRRALEQVAAVGMPDGCCIWVTFSTRHPECEVPAAVAAAHQDSLTVEISPGNHSDLACSQRGFGVTLEFQGATGPERGRIAVPYDSLLEFRDRQARIDIGFKRHAGGPAASPGEAYGGNVVPMRRRASKD